MPQSASLIDLSGSTSSEMIRGIRVGDSAAWKRMTAYYSPLVYSWCRRGGLRPEDAADLMQEVFLSVWRGLEGFQREQSGQTFRGWLRTIARNKIADHFRGNSRRPPTVEAGSAMDRHGEVVESSADQRADCSQLQQLFDQAMETIRPEFESCTWQAFILSTLHKRSAADVAQELGISPGAVRQAKYRILRRLRAELGDCSPG
jgi:RNA polymerase sigma-70 factor (ECF subfamily)